MLSFQMSAAGEGGRIILNTTEIQSEVVNRTTIRHLFKPDTYGTYNVDCRREKKLEASSSHSGVEVVERDGQLYAKLGFCPQRIFVGCKFIHFNLQTENVQLLNMSLPPFKQTKCNILAHLP